MHLFALVCMYVCMCAWATSFHGNMFEWDKQGIFYSILIKRTYIRIGKFKKNSTYSFASWL